MNVAPINPSTLRADLEAYDADLEEIERRRSQRLFHRLFPDQTTRQPDGSLIYARSLYPKQVEFFDAGRQYRERALLAANRLGKTVSGGYEMTCHLTGLYPHWWTGRRFDKPIRAWAAGKTNETTRDIVQTTLLGDILGSGMTKRFSGTGVLPGALLGQHTWKQGVSDLADTIKVQHVSGSSSRLGFKSYQQGRGSFEGTAVHVVWYDEEPPIDVYNEGLIRTATTNGIALMTVTPMEGLTETVLQFMPTEMRPNADE